MNQENADNIYSEEIIEKNKQDIVHHEEEGNLNQENVDNIYSEEIIEENKQNIVHHEEESNLNQENVDNIYSEEIIKENKQNIVHHEEDKNQYHVYEDKNSEELTNFKFQNFTLINEFDKDEVPERNENKHVEESHLEISDQKDKIEVASEEIITNNDADSKNEVNTFEEDLTFSDETTDQYDNRENYFNQEVSKYITDEQFETNENVNESTALFTGHGKVNISKEVIDQSNHDNEILTNKNDQEIIENLDEKNYETHHEHHEKEYLLNNKADSIGGTQVKDFETDQEKNIVQENESLKEKIKELMTLVTENKYEETKDINMEDLYSNQGINAEILNSQELDTVEEECITDDVIGIISSSKSSKMELSCSATQAVKPGSKSKWSMTKSFQFYQQCTAHRDSWP